MHVFEQWEEAGVPWGKPHETGSEVLLGPCCSEVTVLATARLLHNNCQSLYAFLCCRFPWVVIGSTPHHLDSEESNCSSSITIMWHLRKKWNYHHYLVGDGNAAKPLIPFWKVKNEKDFCIVLWCLCLVPHDKSPLAIQRAWLVSTTVSCEIFLVYWTVDLQDKLVITIMHGLLKDFITRGVMRKKFSLPPLMD